jgi:hypothetical protein
VTPLASAPRLSADARKIRWAPRVSRAKIFRLYGQVAQGILDNTLIDDVAYAFYARCDDMRRISERRIICPACNHALPHPHPPHKPVHCARCGWAVSWREYFASYQGKQVMAPTSVVNDYLRDLPRCKTHREKMLLIDRLLHACHKGVKRGEEQLYTRPVAVNLIEGRLGEVIAFLENLPYGPGSGPDLQARLITWRQRCLSEFHARDAEYAQVQAQVDAMPADLRAEIETMIVANHQQQATARLAEIEAYRGELLVLSGDLPREMVKQIKREIKGR